MGLLHDLPARTCWTIASFISRFVREDTSASGISTGVDGLEKHFGPCSEGINLSENQYIQHLKHQTPQPCAAGILKAHSRKVSWYFNNVHVLEKAFRERLTIPGIFRGRGRLHKDDALVLDSMNQLF